MKDANPLATRVKKRREALKLTQEELAEKAGLGNRLMISNIERGKCGVLPETLDALASALKVMPNYLMGLTDAPLPVPVAPPKAYDPKIVLRKEPHSYSVKLAPDAARIVQMLESQTGAECGKIASNIIVQAEKYIRVEGAPL